MKILLASFLIVLSFTSCNSNKEKKEEVKKTQECFYEYDEIKSSLEWVAYKTNDKKPVPGTFNDIKMDGTKGKSPKEVIESLKFKMRTESVETNVPDRNKKIAEHFFNTINTPIIEGEVKELRNDGKAVLMITMNNTPVKVTGNYVLSENDFSFETTIDLSLWNALEGIKTLNDACKELHTGEDGVSKLWEEVKISFKTTLKKGCD